MQRRVASRELDPRGGFCRSDVMFVCKASPALSQSAVGGSIGKQDKSVSGGGEDSGGVALDIAQPRTGAVAQRALVAPRSAVAAVEVAEEAATSMECGASASAGTTCTDRTSRGRHLGWPDVVGRISGRVSGSGSVSGVWSGSGLSATVTGRISGRSGGGSFRRSDGCVGTWTLSKQ